MNVPARGRFITLEGGEGVGKSTQIAALAQALRLRGLDVITTREPGGSPGAEAIRGLLLNGASDAWTPAAEALLFAAARSDHVTRLIRPALERGAWVICDRFVDSTRAYQGAGSHSDDLSDADIMTLHRIGSGGLLPDRTLLLTLDPVTADARRHARNAGQGDRFEHRTADFHAAVSARFRELAAADTARFRTVDASGAPTTVTAALLAAVADLL
jgi:dTMP kinase